MWLNSNRFIPFPLHAMSYYWNNCVFILWFFLLTFFWYVCYSCLIINSSMASFCSFSGNNSSTHLPNYEWTNLMAHCNFILYKLIMFKSLQICIALFHLRQNNDSIKSRSHNQNHWFYVFGRVAKCTTTTKND
jgi:hypothetical protein